MALAGCGQPKGVLFEPLGDPLVWPPPPDPARIHYVGALETSADLKPARSFGQQLDEAFFGKNDVHSMLTPLAVCTDGGDRVFVCDSNGQLIHLFDLESRKYEQWRPETEEGEPIFAQPVGVAYDWLDRLLVSDPVAGVIHVLDVRGNFLGSIGAGIVERPVGIAVDPVRNRIYVADTKMHQVFVFASDGTAVARIGRRGTGPGEFNFPTNVAVDSLGQLYVSDTLNSRVLVFDHDHSFLRQIGSKGDLPGYFSQPKGLALDSEGHLYVVDSHFESIQIYDPGGALLLAFGEEGRGRGQFWLPSGIAIDSLDRIWVADSYNRRVQVFQYRPEVQP